MMEGAFAILVMSENSIYAVRDKYGLRPLSYAKVQDGYCISSETCAYDVIAGTDIVDIKPGEIVKFSDGKVEHFSYTNDIKHCLCAMEYIYFLVRIVPWMELMFIFSEKIRCIAC